MAVQTVFKRYEMKYMLTPEQKEAILLAMEGRMALDRYGRTTIRNLYYDTDTWLMIRRSLEKPSYKEKLRIRSYARAEADSTVFVELKKKYKSVVYKRRVALPCREAMAWAVSKRLILGRADGALAPQANITRAEAAVILERYLDLLSDSGKS